MNLYTIKHIDSEIHDIFINSHGVMTYVGEVSIDAVANQISASGDLLAACELALNTRLNSANTRQTMTEAINKAKGINQ